MLFKILFSAILNFLFGISGASAFEYISKNFGFFCTFKTSIAPELTTYEIISRRLRVQRGGKYRTHDPAYQRRPPGLDYEMVFVDDGSTDGTLAALRSAKNTRLKIIELRKNYGQSLALMAGMDHSEGTYIATLDGDLQNDPADIPGMLTLLEKGDWDVVAGERANRQDGMFLRKIPSKIANWIIRSTSGVKMKDYGCSLRVFKSEIAKGLGLYGELHRFIPVLLHLDGAKMTQVEVRHHPRQFGVSKYGLSRTFKVVSDLLLMLFFKKYMQRPMHLFAT